MKYYEVTATCEIEFHGERTELVMVADVRAYDRQQAQDKAWCEFSEAFGEKLFSCGDYQIEEV